MTDPAATWPRRRVGVLIAGSYLAAVAATFSVSGHGVLPLFEGIGPPPPYAWVHPPPQFAAGNTRPKPASADLAFTSGRTAPATAFTADGQFLVSFGPGAFAPHDPDTSVHVAITPLDPATLGPVPAGLTADGNAYRIELAYRPSQTAADHLAVAGDVIMTAPQAPHALLFSPDGVTWTTLASQTLASGASVGAPFTRPGWYLAGSAGATAAPARGNRLGTAAVAALVAGLALALAALPPGVRAIRRRRERRQPGGRPHRRATEPGGPGGPGGPGRRGRRGRQP